MAARPSAARGKTVANGNGNENGRGITPREGFVSVAAVVAFVVVFAFWWSVADPRTRLDKIEQTALESHKDFILTYTTLREHKELQNLLATQITELQKKDDETRSMLLTKAQFEAWRLERDLYITSISKRIDETNHVIATTLVPRLECEAKWKAQGDRIESQREDIRNLQARIIPREELLSTQTTLNNRLEQLYALYRETQKTFHDLEMREPPRNGK